MWTQAVLAEAAGLPVKSLRNWEQGRSEVSLSAALALADALGVSLDALVGRKGMARPVGWHDDIASVDGIGSARGRTSARLAQDIKGWKTCPVVADSAENGYYFDRYRLFMFRMNEFKDVVAVRKAVGDNLTQHSGVFDRQVRPMFDGQEKAGVLGEPAEAREESGRTMFRFIPEGVGPVVLDASLYNTIKIRFPGAVFFANRQGPKGAVIVEDVKGERVGLIVPIPAPDCDLPTAP